MLLPCRLPRAGNSDPLAAENPDRNDAIRDYVRAYACGTSGPRRPVPSASPATLFGGPWSGDTWAAFCPAPSPAPWGTIPGHWTGQPRNWSQLRSARGSCSGDRRRHSPVGETQSRQAPAVRQPGGRSLLPRAAPLATVQGTGPLRQGRRIHPA